MSTPKRNFIWGCYIEPFGWHDFAAEDPSSVSVFLEHIERALIELNIKACVMATSLFVLNEDRGKLHEQLSSLQAKALLHKENPFLLRGVLFPVRKMLIERSTSVDGDSHGAIETSTGSNDSVGSSDTHPGQLDIASANAAIRTSDGIVAMTILKSRKYVGFALADEFGGEFQRRTIVNYIASGDAASYSRNLELRIDCGKNQKTTISEQVFDSFQSYWATASIDSSKLAKYFVSFATNWLSCECERFVEFAKEQKNSVLKEARAPEKYKSAVPMLVRLASSGFRATFPKSAGRELAVLKAVDYLFEPTFNDCFEAIEKHYELLVTASALGLFSSPETGQEVSSRSDGSDMARVLYQAQDLDWSWMTNVVRSSEDLSGQYAEVMDDWDQSWVALARRVRNGLLRSLAARKFVQKERWHRVPLDILSPASRRNFISYL